MRRYIARWTRGVQPPFKPGREKLLRGPVKGPGMGAGKSRTGSSGAQGVVKVAVILGPDFRVRMLAFLGQH